MMQNTTSPAGIAGQKQGNIFFESNEEQSKGIEKQEDVQVEISSFDLIPNGYLLSKRHEGIGVSTSTVDIPIPDTIIGANSIRQLGVSAEKLLNMNITKIPFLIDGLIHKVGLAAIAGSSDTGKSAFLRYMCMAICSKKHDFLGFEINAKHNKAIYVSTEDDELSTANLLNKQNKALNVSSSELSGLRFVFETDDLLNTLDTMLTDEPSDMVVIDAFTDLFTKSMNDVNQVRSYLNQYSQLAQKHECLFMFLHHCGKRTEDFAPSKHNLIGSQGFEGKMRLVMELRNDLADTNYKHLCCVKGNYLPASDKNESYKLKFTDNLIFENTGDRVPFSELKRTDDSDADIAKYELAVSLQSEGMNLEQIANRLGYKNKSSVSRLLKKYSNT